MQLVSYQPGRIEFCPTSSAPQDLAQRLGSALQRWTGNRWGVSVVSEGGAPTIAALRDAAQLELEEEAARHPMVQAVQAAFPGAKISQIRTIEDQVAEAEAEALPEVDDEWDPFEEE